LILILNGVQSSEPVQTKIPPILPLLWQTGCVCTAQTAIFYAKPVSKFQHPSIQTILVPCLQNWEHGLKTANHYPNLNKTEELPQSSEYDLYDIFLKLNMDEIMACRYTNCVCRRSLRLEAFLYLAAHNFELSSEIQDQN
jgi:hypothetical protein